MGLQAPVPGLVVTTRLWLPSKAGGITRRHGLCSAPGKGFPTSGSGRQSSRIRDAGPPPARVGGGTTATRRRSQRWAGAALLSAAAVLFAGHPGGADVAPPEATTTVAPRVPSSGAPALTDTTVGPAGVTATSQGNGGATAAGSGLGRFGYSITGAAIGGGLPPSDAAMASPAASGPGAEPGRPGADGVAQPTDPVPAGSGGSAMSADPSRMSTPGEAAPDDPGAASVPDGSATAQSRGAGPEPATLVAVPAGRRTALPAVLAIVGFVLYFAPEPLGAMRRRSRR